MMHEIDDYTPTAATKGREAGSKNKASLERQSLIEEARELRAQGVYKISIGQSFALAGRIKVKPSTFAKLI